MAAWQHRLIYFRDFAYPSQPHRSRMPNSDIGDAPAGSFAAYVNGSVTTLPTPPLDPLDRIHKTALVAEELGAESGSDSEQGSKSSSRRSSSDSTRRHSHSRPTLAHRIYTQNLRVQANAKSLRARLLSGPLVDIYVGHSKKHWSLHRNLLCHHSEYLTHELLPTSENEDPESSIDLPDDDPSGFELLVKWLYQGKLDDVSNISDPYQQYDYAVACHALWLICDRFDMPQLKNLAIDQFRQGLYEAELVPDAEEINFIYRKSKKGSPFRRLMTKIAARQIMDPHANKDATSYLSCFRDDPEFAVELVNTIKNDSGGMLFEDPTESGDACIYHDHHDSPDCHQKGKPRTGT
ncbi:hypothetical protein EJ05DRAFT_292320 [Pseudovirgaria hyperparasitica]|uniref:BTB domain-containing protein n=1 Tax=Pseudovirgaria hyperparasitica TaxID=470096 RepID=A0A6A6WD71_9PEZI|nr:uncharacterized protein EJ05DRAFT_292320 [Pseudovirgaria hyperparasitica]KAF2760653.1 hypothetical protein EJ05DRAFT_292320 [Pseudovirgaria hyperparasitica]